MTFEKNRPLISKAYYPLDIIIISLASTIVASKV